MSHPTYPRPGRLVAAYAGPARGSPAYLSALAALATLGGVADRRNGGEAP
ncbi:hypothetical protein M8C11_18855 [Micromonospora sp. CPM1]|nr:hypothetical protein [Micromonospora sp. CPM1]MCO1616777.1 hypothetical protein [Micromonospora sp. CPM1]